MNKKYFIKYLLSIFIIFTTNNCQSSQSQSDWEPSVISGAHLFSKKTLIEIPEVGMITDITVEKSFDGKKTNEIIVICSRYNAIFVDEKGVIREKVTFRLKGTRVVRVNSFLKSNIAFLNRGGGWQPVSVYDNQGKYLWSYGDIKNEETPNDMAIGDINGDGRPEFAIGCSAGGGLLLLNSDGSVLWKQAGKGIWHVEIFDTDGDGKCEIVHSNADGLMVIRNQKGEIIKEKKLFFRFSDFSLIHWPTQEGMKYFLLVCSDKKIKIVNPNGGENLVQFEAPDAPDQFAIGSLVDFKGNKKPYLAVVVSVRASWHRSLLYIYSPEGVLLYQEILATSDPALSALLIKSSGREKLLVGGKGVVWEYKQSTDSDIIKQPADKTQN